MSLILMRHAKSLLNEAPTIPEAHNVLSPLGVFQSLGAGEKLQKAGVTRIISSPVPRAFQTAMIVAGVLGGRKIDIAEPLSELQSRNPHGVDAWLSDEENIKFENDIDHVPAWGLESQRDVWVRSTRYLSEHAFDPSETVLVVTHTFVLRALLAYLNEGSPDAMVKYRPKNAEPMRFALTQIKGSLAQETQGPQTQGSQTQGPAAA